MKGHRERREGEEEELAAEFESRAVGALVVVGRACLNAVQQRAGGRASLS